MKVRELLKCLHDADPEAVVLWLQSYADATDAEEICYIACPQEPWTCERHLSTDGHLSDVHYPSGHGPSLGWDERTDQQWSERVVILSSSPGGPYV
ncbi:hypothetical protein OKW46_003471 [Paraburkholderia sp. WSM4179]|nr:hypothetical protein [Paraburkholderia sp. WSM4179]